MCTYRMISSCTLRTLALLAFGLQLNKAVAQEKVANVSTRVDTHVVSATAEQVQVGYNTSGKQHTTGALSVVPGDRLNGLAPVSIDALLQGQAPGLQVVNTSGAPGAGALTVVRGAATLNAGTEPLYIVD